MFVFFYFSEDKCPLKVKLPAMITGSYRWGAWPNHTSWRTSHESCLNMFGQGRIQTVDLVQSIAITRCVTEPGQGQTLFTTP